MRHKRSRAVRISLERLETRSVPSTLVALIDTGVDLTIADVTGRDAPYYDFTNAYDAYDKLAASNNHSLVQDCTFRDFIHAMPPG